MVMSKVLNQLFCVAWLNEKWQLTRDTIQGKQMSSIQTFNVDEMRGANGFETDFNKERLSYERQRERDRQSEKEREGKRKDPPKRNTSTANFKPLMWLLCISQTDMLQEARK